MQITYNKLYMLAEQFDTFELSNNFSAGRDFVITTVIIFSSLTTKIATIK